jgi:phosphatidylinositol alpha-1,6-mannosyltransferase
MDGREGPKRPVGSVTEVSRRKGMRDWQVFKEIRNHLRQYGRDLPILATVWNPEATLALLAGARRVTILAHGNEVMPYPRNGLKARVRRMVLERARVVVCNSRFTEGLVKQIAPNVRSVVLNPAIDADRFCSKVSAHEARKRLGLSLSKRIILTVARLDPIKGQETVLRAMAELNDKERTDLLYVIIGKGEMKDRLKALTRELALEANVYFPGFVTDVDLALWYRAVNIFILTSIVDTTRRGMEGFGMALTEAQAAGLPVIGTRSGGIPDAVQEGEGGWLIAERDTAALASHLRRLMADPDVFTEQGRRGAERVRREMTWSRYAECLRELM